MQHTKFKQLNKYYYVCEVSGFLYLKLSETPTKIKFEAVANQKNIPFKHKRKNFKNQRVTKYKIDVIKEHL